MEQVVLVNENDEQRGVMEKMEAHEKGELHRAFSVFIFNNNGEMLLQQRAITKYHSAGLWTNACCSHPRPMETIESAATRRLQEELGFTTPIEKIFHFIYNASFENGLTEYEFDYVFIGTYNNIIKPNADEVMAYTYKSVSEIEDSIIQTPQLYTAWFRIAFPLVKERIKS